MCNLFEDVVFDRSHPDAWDLVNGIAGSPLCIDAGRVGWAHRFRAYWSSFLSLADVPEIDFSRGLADVLDVDHRPRRALYTDRFPHARINQAGFRMRRYVTAVRRWDTYSIRDGAGLVELRSSPGTFIRPRPEELELICGFQI